MTDEPIKIIEESCVGCCLCDKACPFDAIEMVDAEKGKLAEIDLTKCTLCGACVDACKFDAIELEESSGPTGDLGAYRGVWVFAEQNDGEIASVTYELLGAGRRLADALGQDLCAVLLGSNVGEGARALIARGAQTVYVADHPELEYFRDEPYARILQGLVERKKPNIVLCGATTIGRSLIARVAVAVNAGLTADCTGLDIDPDTGNLLQTRPAFGGNIMATIITPDVRPQMATVRHKVMPEAEADESRTGDIVECELTPEMLASRTRRVRFVPEVENTVNIAEADIIVAGGRGMAKPENFELLGEFCEVLGAGLAASRAAVDANWIAYSHQVGQTGKTVCPKIYFAVGISGQIQHLVGMSSADVIVAINKDPEAPLFKVATFGIVGDALKVVPMLTREFRQLLGK